MNCLMCNEESNSFWYSQNIPGSYCIKCISVVIDLHEFFERYNFKLIESVKEISKKGYTFDHKKGCS